MEDDRNSGGIIDRKIDLLRQAFARHVFWRGLAQVFTLVLSVLFLIVIVEGFRYFNGTVRRDILTFFSAFGLIFLAIPVVYYFQIRRQKITTYDDYYLAKLIGANQPDIQDDLLNALQLRATFTRNAVGSSTALIGQAIDRVARKIESRDFGQIVPAAELRKAGRRLVAVIVGIALCVALSPDYFKAGMERLLHPGREYPVQLPFTIESVRASFGVLGGDSATVGFRCAGRFPERLTLEMQFPDYVQREVLPVDSVGRCSYRLGNLRHDIVYTAYYENRSPFKPWRRISSPADTIRVINRPEILQVKARFNYPDYTKLPPQTQTANVAEFNLVNGTQFQIEVRVNKPISAGRLRFTGGTILPLSVKGNRATGVFTVANDDQFEIIVEDERQVTNLNPIKYRLQVTPDAYPSIVLLSPKNDFDLVADMNIPLGIRISDDFGFSRAAIRYRLIKRYADYQAGESEAPFPVDRPDVSLQELYQVWNISELGLGPEDAVEFRIEIFDNDPLTGPKKASTATRIARFPSLNELFAEVNDEQEEIGVEAAEVLDRLETASQALDEVARELLKKPEMKWEQKKQISEEMKRTREAAEKISQLGDRLDDLIEKSRDNQLFNAETLDKLSQVQEAFRDILTPEMRAALDKLQAAIDKMDAREIQKALNNFKTSQQQFSQELDRLLKIFRRIRIEQNVDELTRRFNDLADRQAQIQSDLEKARPDNRPKMDELAQAEDALKKDTKTAQEFLDKTAADMAEFPMMPNAELQQLIEEMQAMRLPQDQTQAADALRQGQKSQAGKSAQRAQQNLQSLAAQMEKFREELNQRNMADVMSDFRLILGKTVQLSQTQENLVDKISNTPRQSDQIMDVAVEQNQAHQNLSRLIKDLIDLSGKTFGVTPRIGKNLGQAAAEMRSAIGQMEERNPSQAARAASQATAALNMTALELMAAMQELQASGSSSGFENYLEQLKKMAGQQQGLNDDTQMLGAGSPGGNQFSMQQLAARQQQIRQSLQQLQEQVQGGNKQSGDLGGIAKDMDEVIRDLQNNQVLRRTIERQQRILSRLLDAQKSLRTQDFKEERQSKTGTEIERVSPVGLPANLGERRTFLQENLEKALRAGYSKEYEELIRRYFEELSQEPAE